MRKPGKAQSHLSTGFTVSKDKFRENVDTYCLHIRHF